MIGIRLKKVADLIEPNSTIIDVGCDHALLDIYLIEKHIGIRAIASDNKEGPVKHAQDNVKAHHLENVIQVKMGDGLDPVDEETDTIVISGMGGRNMIGIFKNNLDIFRRMKTIVISPNNDVELIRKFVVEQGFYLEKETMVEEKKIIYPILKFYRGRKHYSRKELYFGPIFLKEKSELFCKYFKKELNRKEITLHLLPKKYLRKRILLKKQIKEIKKVLES